MEFNEELFERIQNCFDKYFSKNEDYYLFEEIVFEVYIKLCEKIKEKEINNSYIYLTLKTWLYDKLNKKNNAGVFSLNDMIEYEDFDIEKFEQNDYFTDKKEKDFKLLMWIWNFDEKMLIRTIYNHFQDDLKITIKEICKKENWNYDNIRKKISRIRQQKDKQNEWLKPQLFLQIF